MMKQLVVICTHPIQYYVPLWRKLHQDQTFETLVVYTSDAKKNLFDKGFGQEISWDIDLTSGYDHRVVAVNSFADRLKLLSFLNHKRPDAVLVVGWNPPGHLVAMLYAKLFSKSWFRGDSHLLNKTGTWRKIVRHSFLKAVYRLTDVAFYVGNANKAYFCRNGLTEGQLIHAPHAIDQEWYAQQVVELSKSMAKSKLGVDHKKFVFGFVGKFEEVKCPLEIVEAFQSCASEEAALLMVGSGPLEEVTKSKAKNDPRIRLLGFQNQTAMPSIMRAFDVLVLFSKSETWGLVVNESLAVGTPVILSDQVGCHSDVLASASSTVIVKSGHVEGLKKAFERKLQDWNDQSQSAQENECLAASRSFHMDTFTRAIAAEMNKIL